VKEISKIAKALTLASFFIDPRKDIEVFGMFGPGNLGDESMLVAAKNSLPRERLIPWQNYKDRPVLESLIQRRKRPHLLVCGGTLIHGGNTGWLDYVEMRSQQGARISFFGTGIAFTENQVEGRSEPFERWCQVLKSADQVYLRGPQSSALSKDMCGQGEVFGDFAFLLHRHDWSANLLGDHLGTIGINLGNCLDYQEAFEQAAVRIVKHLALSHQLAFHAVEVSDLKVIHRVIHGAGLSPETYFVDSHFYDPYAFMEAIKNYSAFLGLKLHAAGLAMVAGVPSLMIGYLPKCYDFMAALASSEHMVLSLPLNPDRVLEKLGQLMSSPEQFVRSVEIAKIAAKQRMILRRAFVDDQV